MPKLKFSPAFIGGIVALAVVLFIAFHLFLSISSLTYGGINPFN
jgi:hypothetical protein